MIAGTRTAGITSLPVYGGAAAPSVTATTAAAVLVTPLIHVAVEDSDPDDDLHPTSTQALVLAEVSKPNLPERPLTRHVGRWTVTTFVAAWVGQQALLVAWFIGRCRMGGGAIRRRAAQIWNRPSAA